jgi:hypothetical protein
LPDTHDPLGCDELQKAKSRAAIDEYRRIVNVVSKTPAQTLQDFLQKAALISECLKMESSPITATVAVQSLFADFDKLLTVCDIMRFAVAPARVSSLTDAGPNHERLREACADFWKLSDRLKAISNETAGNTGGFWSGSALWLEWEHTTNRLSELAASNLFELTAKKGVVDEWLQAGKDFDVQSGLLLSLFKDFDSVLRASLGDRKQHFHQLVDLSHITE